ncbi:hypothetical protein Vadar_030267 [Vaccinium darrowii]|uniref:Uncharacterized protein n=1 Tax=Vaccinium darrowii TaxID=229202 RepID=A0ACB7ZMJ3_9ERIC|nr:hypothetical protein Vadar_030267 [Vaccinium darrowii]
MGMAPNAHLAIYKISFYDLPVFESDLLAGMDKAIADGIDLMSLSLAFPEIPFYTVQLHGELLLQQRNGFLCRVRLEMTIMICPCPMEQYSFEYRPICVLVVVCPCPVSPSSCRFVGRCSPPAATSGSGRRLLNGEVCAPVFCAAAVGFGGYWVPCADYFGYAKGVAMGMTPKAHLAMYKIGFYDLPVFECDLLAGMDKAIADGIDLMSLSLAFLEIPFYTAQLHGELLLQ